MTAAVARFVWFKCIYLACGSVTSNDGIMRARSKDDFRRAERAGLTGAAEEPRAASWIRFCRLDARRKSCTLCR